MAKFSTESLDWLDKLAAVNQMRKEDPNRTGVSMAAQLKISPAHASYLTSLNDCLDQAAIDKIRQAASPQSGPPFLLSLKSARILPKLYGKVSDLPGAIHTALDVILSRRLAKGQIEKLVEWMLKGNPADTFKESETGTKDKSDKKTGDEPKDLTAQVMELAEKANAEKARNEGSPDGDRQTAARDKLKALLEKIIEEAKKEGASGKEGKEDKKSKSPPKNNSDWIWKWMLGKKFVSLMRSKAKKGQLTTTEKFLIIVDKVLVEPLGRMFKHIRKFFKKMVESLWHSAEEAAGKTFKKVLEVVLPLLIICVLVWAILAFFHFAVISPIHWLESKVRSGFHWRRSENSPTPVPTSPSVASSPSPANGLNYVPLAQPKRVARHEASQQVYQPAVSFVPAVEDPKILEQEIAAIQKNSFVKDHPLTPDEGMPGDVALSRMQDVIDPDKYTMMIGSGKEIIQSVNATNTTLTLYYKSADPLDIWGGKGPMNFLWEDVKYIHTNAIYHGALAQSNPASQLVASTQIPTFYQCTLVVKGAKNPLTIQCDSTDDLENLVSTMEYFIRHSRLGHDAQPGGMPYPTQGVRLGNDCVVEKLWADSPAGRAGVGLGEMIWSVDTNAYYPPDRKKLETALAGLGPGAHNLFVASHPDWDKAQSDVAFHRASSLNPKRQKITLTTP